MKAKKILVVLMITFLSLNSLGFYFKTNTLNNQNLGKAVAFELRKKKNGNPGNSQLCAPVAVITTITFVTWLDDDDDEPADTNSDPTTNELIPRSGQALASVEMEKQIRLNRF